MLNNRAMKESSIGIRIEADLRAELQKMADAESRSLSSMIILILKDAVSKSKKAKKPK